MFYNNSSIVNTFKKRRNTILIERVFIFANNSCLISNHFSFWSKVVTITIISLVPAFDSILINDFFDPC